MNLLELGSERDMVVYYMVYLRGLHALAIQRDEGQGLGNSGGHRICLRHIHVSRGELSIGRTARLRMKISIAFRQERDVDEKDLILKRKRERVAPPTDAPHPCGT